jgi:hypothetical protein
VGWLFRSEHPTGRSIILVHSWQGNREDVDFVALTRQLLPRDTVSSPGGSTLTGASGR